MRLFIPVLLICILVEAVLDQRVGRMLSRPGGAGAEEIGRREGLAREKDRAPDQAGQESGKGEAEEKAGPAAFHGPQYI